MLARFSRLMVLGVAVVALASCAPVQHPDGTATHTDNFGTPVGSQQVRSGGDLVMGLSAEPDKLDPTTSSSLYTRYVMGSICQKLYDNDASGNLVPQLATEMPTVTDEGLTVTIPVRNDIKFADGTPFDATAVKTSLDRHFSMKGSQRTSEMGPIAGIEVADPSNVVIRYKKPFAPITAALADRAGMIMSPTALAKDEGKNFADNPVCVGPFKFVKRVPQTSIIVERDPLYYDAKNVHLDKVTYRIMIDANIRASNLRSGDIQVADTISPQDVDALAKDPDLKVLQTGSLGFQGIFINIGNVDGVGKPAKQIETPLAKDARIRQALSLSIDRNTLVDTVFNNWYEPACSAIVPKSTFATPAGTDCPPYDPKKSRELLKEAGVQIPFPITLQVQTRQDDLRMAQALQANVAEGGFDLKVVPVEYSALLDVQKKGTYEAHMLGWSGRLDPDANISRFFATKSSGNYMGYSSPKVDALLAKAAAATDTAQRAELYGQVTQAIAEDSPYVYTYRLRLLTAHTTKVTGVEVYADGVVRLGKAAFVDSKD